MQFGNNRCLEDLPFRQVFIQLRRKASPAGRLDKPHYQGLHCFIWTAFAHTGPLREQLD